MQCYRDVVSRAWSFYPVQKPKAQLSIRQGQGRRPLLACERAAGLVGFRDTRRQFTYCGRFEQGANGQFHTQGLAYPADQLCREQRVATECEEVVVEAD